MHFIHGWMNEFYQVIRLAIFMVSFSFFLFLDKKHNLGGTHRTVPTMFGRNYSKRKDNGTETTLVLLCYVHFVFLTWLNNANENIKIYFTVDLHNRCKQKSNSWTHFICYNFQLEKFKKTKDVLFLIVFDWKLWKQFIFFLFTLRWILIELNCDKLKRMENYCLLYEYHLLFLEYDGNCIW